MKKYIKIDLINAPAFISESLVYSFDDTNISLEIGDIVSVPFGKKELDGIVIEFLPMSRSNDYKYKIRDIIGIKNDKLQSNIIHISKKMSEYYFTSFASCLKLFLPKNLFDIQEEEETFFSLVSQIDLQTIRGNKQKQVIEFLQNNGETEKSQLLMFTDSTTATLKTLLEKQLIKSETLLKVNDTFIVNKQNLKQLNTEQEQALEILKSSPKSLLHGITGSGKTEVFLHFLVNQFEKFPDSQSLILVPEIALTPQTIQYFQKVFPHQIAVIHSKINDTERCRIWRKVQKGDIKLIIGSRSALFLPWKNLQTIIMDEAHEWTYKSDKNPRYHAQKVAELFLEDIPNSHLILASATPDICDYYKTETGEYKLAEIKNQAAFSSVSPITIIDMRQEFLRKNFSPISEELDRKIQSTLKKGKQIILFLNKRGFAQSLQCKECGEMIMCPHCDVPMTKHQNQTGSKLICHYCFLVKTPPTQCPRCQSPSINERGLGTQKIEEELEKRYSNAKILRADRDTTTGKYDFEKMYQQMKEGKADILLGTQMIAKGLDLPNVELVGVLSADSGLHVPDFRSSERVFQILTQVAGRAGRHSKGEVIFQTFQPHHEVVQAASMYSYQTIYKQEIETRKLLNYPPFSKVIKLTFTEKDKKKALEISQKLFQKLQLMNAQISENKCQISFAPSFIPKMHDKYFFHVLIRGKNPEHLLEKLQKNSPESLDYWRIDRDPIILC